MGLFFVGRADDRFLLEPAELLGPRPRPAHRRPRKLPRAPSWSPVSVWTSRGAGAGGFAQTGDSLSEQAAAAYVQPER